MATKTVVMDRELRYFETTPMAAGLFVSSGSIEPVLSHYGGDFENALTFSIVGKNAVIPRKYDKRFKMNNRTLEDVRKLAGCDALTQIKQGWYE